MLRKTIFVGLIVVLNIWGLVFSTENIEKTSIEKIEESSLDKHTAKDSQDQNEDSSLVSSLPLPVLADELSMCENLEFI